MDKIEATGLMLVLIVMAAIFALISQINFPAFTYTNASWIKVKTSGDIGSETASFMWNYRYLDLIAQAIILFGAAVGCIAILRREKEGDSHD